MLSCGLCNVVSSFLIVRLLKNLYYRPLNSSDASLGGGGVIIYFHFISSQNNYIEYQIALINIKPISH